MANSRILRLSICAAIGLSLGSMACVMSNNLATPMQGTSQCIKLLDSFLDADYAVNVNNHGNSQAIESKREQAAVNYLDATCPTGGLLAAHVAVLEKADHSS